MVRTIPKTLREAINEEPERFASYLNIPRIARAKNPYVEFLRQFERAFGQKQGLSLWQYVVNKYSLLNQLYKSEDIQSELPEKFVGALSMKETSIFFEKRRERIMEKQMGREEEVRIERPKKHQYTDREQRFILARRDLPLREVAYEFNKAFGTLQTRIAIRDKRLRLLGRKK